MKRILLVIIAIAMLGTMVACSSASSDITSGSGDIVLSPSSSLPTEAPPPESPPAGNEVPTESQPTAPVNVVPDEVRSVWISYLELENMLRDSSAEQFRVAIAEYFTVCRDYGLNTAVLHVRPFGDAIYPSKLFPTSYMFTGSEGQVGEVPFDALAIAIDEAHKRGLRLEAWINPYRVRNKGSNKPLSATNPASALLASGDAVGMGEVITYNPASKLARQLIVDGVVEIIENYDVDAIHFDDYFYPTTSEDFDSKQYSDYKAAGGKAELAQWRRDNVTMLVQQVHEAINSTKPSVLFGISPQGNMSQNLNSQFVDVEAIVKAGLVDYICPQIYFGFNNSTTPFQPTIESFDRMTAGTDVALYIGLSTYKFNKPDTWAGSGKTEWIGCTDMLSRQVTNARKLSGYGGFVLFRYDSSFAGERYYSDDTTAQSQLLTEMKNLGTLLH